MTDRSQWRVRKAHLHDPEPDDDLRDVPPGERMAMVWPITATAWAFKFLVVGAYALAAHGLPRATRVLDLWLGTTGSNPQRIDVLTSIDGVDFAPAWSAKLDAELEGLRVPVLSREHLIQYERATRRPQDLADLAWLEGREDG